MNIIYVGRLEAEKWIVSLIFSLQKLIDHQSDFHIHIYGWWSFAPQIQDLWDTYPRYVSYYWRQDKKDIIWQRKRSDFFVMPSLFLETFGLTACESLLYWVPVIGNKRWWLIPFIDDTLDIQQADGTHDGEKLYTILSSLIDLKTPKSYYKNLIKTT